MLTDSSSVCQQGKKPAGRIGLENGCLHPGIPTGKSGIVDSRQFYLDRAVIFYYIRKSSVLPKSVQSHRCGGTKNRGELLESRTGPSRARARQLTSQAMGKGNGVEGCARSGRDPPPAAMQRPSFVQFGKCLPRALPFFYLPVFCTKSPGKRERFFLADFLVVQEFNSDFLRAGFLPLRVRACYFHFFNSLLVVSLSPSRPFRRSIFSLTSVSQWLCFPLCLDAFAVQAFQRAKNNLRIPLAFFFKWYYV